MATRKVFQRIVQRVLQTGQRNSSGTHAVQLKGWMCKWGGQVSEPSELHSSTPSLMLESSKLSQRYACVYMCISCTCGLTNAMAHWDSITIFACDRSLRLPRRLERNLNFIWHLFGSWSGTNQHHGNHISPPHGLDLLTFEDLR